MLCWLQKEDSELWCCFDSEHCTDAGHQQGKLLRAQYPFKKLTTRLQSFSQENNAHTWLYRIKISGALDWIQYIPFTSLSFPEDLVQFLLRSFSLFMIPKYKNYLCEWHSCSQQGEWREFGNFWNSGQYSWLSILLLMLHIGFTEVTKAQTNPCWLVQGHGRGFLLESHVRKPHPLMEEEKKSCNFLNHNSYPRFNPRALQPANFT